MAPELMTLDAFRATGRDVIDLGAEIPGMDLEGDSGRVYLYEGGPFIELVVDGSWMLILGNEHWIERDIAPLEERLYEWAKDEGFFEQPVGTLQRFNVTVWAEGNPDFRTTVEARDEWHARAVAMLSYPHQLRGQTVTYEVTR